MTLQAADDDDSAAALKPAGRSLIQAHIVFAAVKDGRYERQHVSAITQEVLSVDFSLSQSAAPRALLRSPL